MKGDQEMIQRKRQATSRDTTNRKHTDANAPGVRVVGEEEAEAGEALFPDNGDLPYLP